jgi:hypothetical protein
VKARIVWKDGREEEFEDMGALHFIKMWRNAGRFYQTTFTRGPHGSHQLFFEGETKDRTDDMHRAEAENRQRTMDYLRKGWASSDCALKSCKCPCHAGSDSGGTP